MTDDREVAAQAQHLEDAIRPILAGQHPGIQGATLASLLACWLAGHHPDLREKLIEAHMKATRQLIPCYEALIDANQRRRWRRSQ